MIEWKVKEIILLFMAMIILRDTSEFNFQDPKINYVVSQKYLGCLYGHIIIAMKISQTCQCITFNCCDIEWRQVLLDKAVSHDFVYKPCICTTVVRIVHL